MYNLQIKIILIITVFRTHSQSDMFQSPQRNLEFTVKACLKWKCNNLRDWIIWVNISPWVIHLHFAYCLSFSTYLLRSWVNQSGHLPLKRFFWLWHISRWQREVNHIKLNGTCLSNDKASLYVHNWPVTWHQWPLLYNQNN